MKNKKRINFGVLIATILVVAIIGTIGVKKMTEPTEKEKQIAFLKEHEEEMTEYVKSQNSKIYSVQYDWESVEVGTIGNGTSIGAGKILTIDGKFNSIYDSSFYLQFKFDKSTKLPSIKSMTSYNSFRIGGMLYE
ncbi:hypothetical protein ABE931_13785 [Enterococcus faecalis]|uniref:hypothetical protein n=1 Tax=Enterococcus faecalis TaxID=1351 RepID=UPI003D6A1A7D